MTETLWFSSSVAEKLRYYVYRLIDPRNNETFYVGKGKGNRIFAHVKGEIGFDEDALSAKLQKIREIREAGYSVIHVIHRHDMDELTAFEVESALIDAYPETNNIVSGRASNDRGLMTAKQIINRYEAKNALFKHTAVMININRLIHEKSSIYEAVRYAWKLNVTRARSADFILAVDRGLIVGAFIAEKWLKATKENFPHEKIEFPERWGFIGQSAPKEITDMYLNCRIPDNMRKPGSSNPIRYT